MDTRGWLGERALLREERPDPQMMPTVGAQISNLSSSPKIYLAAIRYGTCDGSNVGKSSILWMLRG